MKINEILTEAIGAIETRRVTSSDDTRSGLEIAVAVLKALRGN